MAHGEEDKLYSRGLYMKECNFIPEPPAGKVFECFAKFRYRQPEQKVTLNILSEDDVGFEAGYRYRVDFYEKQRAVTEGQFCVLYDEEKCLGGGVIESVVF